MRVVLEIFFHMFFSSEKMTGSEVYKEMGLTIPFKLVDMSEMGLKIQMQSNGKNSLCKKKNRRRGLTKVSQDHRDLEVSEECLTADAAIAEAVMGNEARKPCYCSGYL